MGGIKKAVESVAFQFQYGSIGSRNGRNVNTNFIVSIPVWFDWE